MAITIDKIEEAQEKLNDVQAKASDINEILIKAREAILSDGEGNAKIELTKEQKIALLAEYQVRKQSLINSVNNLL